MKHMKSLDKEASREFMSKAVRIVLGSAIYAAGFRFFIYPQAIPSGGVNGIGMIINYLTGFPVGVMGVILNIPLFLIAWRVMGWRFIVASAVGMGLSSLLIDVFSLIPLCITDDILMACLFGGAVEGFGLGLVYSAGATTGGVDIVVKLLRRRYQYINFGTLMLGIDVTIIVCFVLIFKKYDNILYGILAMFICSKVIDFVLYGAGTSKLCYIISDASEQVKNDIVEKLNRGVTMLKGTGAYSGKEKQVLLCVVKRRQVVELRRLVRESDANAFLIFTDARDVFGEGFMSIYSND